MKEIKITKKELFEQYDKSIDEYLDICDWVTYIDSKKFVVLFMVFYLKMISITHYQLKNFMSYIY
jgi:hypothetical protein